MPITHFRSGSIPVHCDVGSVLGNQLMKLKRLTHAVLQTFFCHSNALTTGTKENFVLVASKVLVFTLHNVVHVISVPLSVTSAPL